MCVVVGSVDCGLGGGGVSFDGPILNGFVNNFFIAVAVPVDVGEVSQRRGQGMVQGVYGRLIALNDIRRDGDVYGSVPQCACSWLRITTKFSLTKSVQIQ